MKQKIPLLHNFRLNDEQESHEEVVSKIYSNIVFKGTNLWILVFAILIACLGLNVNSTAVIIGAMLISPLMGPIMGLGMGLAINDLSLLRRSAFNYFFAAGVGLAASTLYFVLSPLNDAHSEILSRTAPNIYDVLIALFGGLAGILATSSKLKGNVLPGVAIATALMPPLCTAGYGLSELRTDYFFGAFYLFLINTVFIALATFGTARILKFPFKHLPDVIAEKRSRRIIFIITLVTVLPSLYFGWNIVQQNKFEHQANLFIENEAQFPNDYLLQKKIDAKTKTISLTYGGQKISREDSSALTARLGKYDIGNATLIVHQGFTYIDNINAGDKTTEMNMALMQKDRILEFYQKQLDSIHNQQNISVKIFKELQIQYPQISSFLLAPAVQMKDSVQSMIWVSIIKSKSEMTENDREKLKKWLAVRISEDKLNCIFETESNKESKK